jgi:hypothetical protein
MVEYCPNPIWPRYLAMTATVKTPSKVLKILPVNWIRVFWAILRVKLIVLNWAKTAALVTMSTVEWVTPTAFGFD